jgi:orotidine-5'-phosphate decarboxylase
MIGLDPILDRLPTTIQRSAAGVAEFNREIIEATRDLVIGYKPNFAFYEALGAAGWEALAETRKAIPRELIALADAKRGDIGSTSELYAQAILDSLGFDAMTVSPYVGLEGLAPFLAREKKGVFVLGRTSNRDGSVQDLELSNGVPVYEQVADMATTWGDNVGLVIGATDLEAAATLRERHPNTPFLVPGIGVQGATVGDALRHAATADGRMAMVSASRSVIYASSESDFAEAARRRAEELLQEAYAVRV